MVTAPLFTLAKTSGVDRILSTQGKKKLNIQQEHGPSEAGKTR
jgi:hypothetical protein